MPRYHFDCVCDAVLHPDERGVELRRDEVPDHAMEVVLETLKAGSRGSAGLRDVRVDVRDEQGERVYTAHGRIRGTSFRPEPSAVPAGGR